MVNFTLKGGGKMKNYEDFKATTTDDVIDSMMGKVLQKLNLISDEEPIEDPYEKLVWFTRSYNLSVTIRLLEKYHNWLHNS